jgi:hypothetical protein
VPARRAGLIVAGFRALADGDAVEVLRCMAVQQIVPDPESFTPEDVVETLMAAQPVVERRRSA